MLKRHRMKSARAVRVFIVRIDYRSNVPRGLLRFDELIVRFLERLMVKRPSIHMALVAARREHTRKSSPQLVDLRCHIAFAEYCGRFQHSLAFTNAP